MRRILLLTLVNLMASGCEINIGRPDDYDQPKEPVYTYWVPNREFENTGVYDRSQKNFLYWYDYNVDVPLSPSPELLKEIYGSKGDLDKIKNLDHYCSSEWQSAHPESWFGFCRPITAEEKIGDKSVTTTSISFLPEKTPARMAIDFRDVYMAWVSYLHPLEPFGDYKWAFEDGISLTYKPKDGNYLDVTALKSPWRSKSFPEMRMELGEKESPGRNLVMPKREIGQVSLNNGISIWSTGCRLWQSREIWIGAYHLSDEPSLEIDYEQWLRYVYPPVRYVGKLGVLVATKITFEPKPGYTGELDCNYLMSELEKKQNLVYGHYEYLIVPKMGQVRALRYYQFYRPVLSRSDSVVGDVYPKYPAVRATSLGLKAP